MAVRRKADFAAVTEENLAIFIAIKKKSKLCSRYLRKNWPYEW